MKLLMSCAHKTNWQNDTKAYQIILITEIHKDGNSH